MTNDNGKNNRFRLAPGVVVLRRDAERLTIKAPQASVDLGGASADMFETRILPLLDGRRDVAEIAAQAGLADADALAEILTELNRAGLLLSAGTEGGDPFLDYLEMIGLRRPETAALLQDLRVAVFGEGALVDEIVSALNGLKLGEVRTYGAGDPDRLAEAALIGKLEGMGFVVSAFGAVWPAIDHRLNRVAHRLGLPILFCRLGVGSSTVGPLVFPYETACFTCANMRMAACASDFAAHMDYEEASSARPGPVHDPLNALPHLAKALAGEAVNQILMTRLALGRAGAVDHLLEYAPFRTGWTAHPVLRRPDCPTCSKKNFTPPEQPDLNGLEGAESGDLAAHIGNLVSPLTGIVRSLGRVHKDLSEPQLPYIWRAELANHRFLDSDKDSQIVASGKGFTPDLARLSAMGEAVERYASSTWGEERLLRGRADELPIPALDPARLVLFRPEQYAHLKYCPYRPDSNLGWVAMRSLRDGGERAVPALAVLMAYETQGAEPFLFPITSNGLAAGPTLADAVLSGAYEVIERDAFLLTWLNRLPCRRVEPADHPDPQIRALLATHARRGIGLELFLTPTDNDVFVFIGIAFAPTGGKGLWANGPAAVVGLGADHDPARAAAGALVEACQVRPALRMRLRQPETQARIRSLLDDPQSVAELEDHDLLYAVPEMLGQFDFLRNAAPQQMDWHQTAPASATARLRALTQTLADQGTEMLYANLTSQDIRPLGAHVARVVIPDYQPMHFGYRERRLAASRLYRFPERLGLPATGPDSLNPYPHPLA